MKSARCSSLPLYAKCPGAWDPELPTNPSNPQAELGTLTHEYLAAMVSQKPARDVVGRDVDFEEYQILCATGRKCWARLEQFFPNPSIEVNLRGAFGGRLVELTGHADVFSLVPEPEDGLGQVRILDWKTGRNDEDHEAQMKGYALLALLLSPEAPTASTCLVRLRDQTADWEHFDRQELMAWWVSLSGTLLSDRPNFNPGRHCGYCPRGLTCHAKRALVAHSVDVLETGPALQLDASNIGVMYDRIKLVESACENAKEMIRAAVADAGGSMPTNDGRELVITRQDRRSVNYGPARPLLASTFSEAEQAAFLRVSKTDLEKTMRAKAPRGLKEKAAAELIESLEAAGAVRTETIERLDVRRALTTKG